MAWIAASTAYAVLGLVIGCRIANSLAWNWVESRANRYPYLYGAKRDLPPDGEQWFGAGLIGLVCAFVWPFVGIAILLRGFLFAPPKHVQFRQQEKRIKELEKQLEIS